MKQEPEYLRHLGDLATLKNFLGSCYHQDASIEFGTDEDRWRAFHDSASSDEMERVREQVEVLAGRPTDEIHDFLWRNADALRFSNPEESREWLEDFQSWLQEAGS